MVPVLVDLRQTDGRVRALLLCYSQMKPSAELPDATQPGTSTETHTCTHLFISLRRGCAADKEGVICGRWPWRLPFPLCHRSNNRFHPSSHHVEFMALKPFPGTLLTSHILNNRERNQTNTSIQRLHHKKQAATIQTITPNLTWCYCFNTGRFHQSCQSLWVTTAKMYKDVGNINQAHLKKVKNQSTTLGGQHGSN